MTLLTKGRRTIIQGGDVMARKTGITRLLSTKEKVVITLTANGISDPDISEVLNLRQGNIRQFRLKALRKLKEQ